MCVHPTTAQLQLARSHKPAGYDIIRTLAKHCAPAADSVGTSLAQQKNILWRSKSRSASSRAIQGAHELQGSLVHAVRCPHTMFIGPATQAGFRLHTCSKNCWNHAVVRAIRCCQWPRGIALPGMVPIGQAYHCTWPAAVLHSSVGLACGRVRGCSRRCLSVTKSRTTSGHRPLLLPHVPASATSAACPLGCKCLARR